MNYSVGAYEIRIFGLVLAVLFSMSFLRRFKIMSLGLVSILMTVGGLFKVTLAQANTVRCQQLFLSEPISVLSIKEKAENHIQKIFDGLDQNYYKSSVHFSKDFQNFLENVNSPTDYLLAVSLIRDLSILKVRQKTNYYPYKVNETILGEDLIYEIGQVDLVKPLVRVKEKMTKAQRETLNSLLSSFYLPSENGGSKNNYYEKAWSEIFEPIRIVFWPERILQYLDRISYNQEFVANPRHAFQFGISLKSAIEQLPTKYRQRAKQKISELVFSETQERWEGDKNQRRNREIVHRLIFDDEFQFFLTSIKNKKDISVDGIIKAVDLYWSKISIYPNRDRGHYSMRRVLDVARALQRSAISPYLKDDYILMYGSFVNGKANLESSDIDIHLGPQFLKQYMNLQLTSQYHNPEKSPISEHFKLQPSERSLQLSREFVETEKSLAQILDRKKYEPSELMTHIPVEDSFFEIQNLGVYNSLVLKITESKISLMVVDSMNRNEIHETEIKF